MSSRIVIALAAFVVGAAAFFAVELVFPVQAANGCSVAASAAWTPKRGRAFPTEAFANGPNCKQAVATIIVRAPDGAVRWADAAPAEHLMTLAGAKTRGQMARALKDWLAQTHMFKSSADLPPWPKGADAPQAGEFPFYPEPGVDRDSYEQTRAARDPIFCYVQGMESMACLVLSKDGQMSKIGVQAFPG